MESHALDKETRLGQLYLSIIARYKGYIEEKEEIAVAELPTLVLPRGELVTRKAAEIKAAFPNYSYDNDFPKAALKAFEFVRDRIEEVILPLQFWLTPDESLEFRLGDRIDRNILLCSILIALGNPDSKVFVIKRESLMTTYTYFNFSGRTVLMDLSNVTSVLPSRDDMIKQFRIGEDDTAYEFNHQSYIDVC
jgi:hypothetical protein